MKIILFSILLLFGVEALGQAQKGMDEDPVGIVDLRPAFGTPYTKCVEWEEPEEPIVERDGETLHYPSVCIFEQICEQQAVPGEPIKAQCACYQGLKKSHPQWCEDCAYPYQDVDGFGETYALAEKAAKNACEDIFKEIREYFKIKDPTHYDFRIEDCHQVGQEICEEPVPVKR